MLKMRRRIPRDIERPQHRQPHRSAVHFQRPVFATNPFADFLLGLPSVMSQGSLRVNAVRAPGMALFLQDDWKIRQNLSLSLGVRWEPFFPFYDANDRMSVFRPGQQSTVYPLAPPRDCSSSATRACRAAAWRTTEQPRAARRVRLESDARRQDERPRRLRHLLRDAGHPSAERVRQHAAVLGAGADQPAVQLLRSVSRPGRSRSRTRSRRRSRRAATFSFLQPAIGRRDPAARPGRRLHAAVELQHPARDGAGHRRHGRLRRLEGQRSCRCSASLNPAIFGPGATTANINQRRIYAPYLQHDRRVRVQRLFHLSFAAADR